MVWWEHTVASVFPDTPERIVIVSIVVFYLPTCCLSLRDI